MRFGNFDISRADQNNITLSNVCTSKTSGAEYLNNQKYYSTWEAAIIRAFELGLRSETAEELLKEIQSSKKEILSELKKLKELK